MDVLGHVRLTDERPVGSRRDLDVRPLGELEDPDRVRGRLVECLVPGDRRDAEELDLGTREREEDGDRVVVPGIAVEEDRDRAQGRSSPSNSLLQVTIRPEFNGFRLK
jgi:hypothetical protein